MSRRFGRNQKRAMRAKIADLEYVSELQNITIARLKMQLNEADTVIERTAQVLGDHFATLPVKTHYVKDMLDRFQISIFEPERSWSMRAAVMRSLTTLEIEPYQASLHVDELRSMIHLRYASESGQVGYGLSDQAWKNMRTGHLVELLEKQIASQMATLLVKDHLKRRHI